VSVTGDPAAVDVAACAVRALTLYSLAEFQSGHASTIRVRAGGAAFGVEDDGRGHAIDRTVAGLPYLPFVYTHLDYPFSSSEGGPVQLQGIGMSLLNALCSEMTVTVRKTGETLHSTYRDGRLCEQVRIASPAGPTGNRVSGTVRAELQPADTDVERIGQWLEGVRASNPTLVLYFNDRRLQSPP
jgi:DNA gyrase/topoisomerase IV subunit B